LSGISGALTEGGGGGDDGCADGGVEAGEGGGVVVTVGAAARLAPQYSQKRLSFGISFPQFSQNMFFIALLPSLCETMN
jgi:hypothetical protein